MFITYRMVKGMKYSDFTSVKEACEDFKEKFPFCMHCRSLLVDIYTEEGNKEKAIAVCLFSVLFNSLF